MYCTAMAIHPNTTPASSGGAELDVGNQGVQDAAGPVIAQRFQVISRCHVPDPRCPLPTKSESERGRSRMWLRIVIGAWPMGGAGATTYGAASLEALRMSLKNVEPKA
jgi:hypothetical protein